MPEKFEINLNKKEIKSKFEDINKTDYYKRIASQVKKIKSGQMNKAFKGNAKIWKKQFHDTTLEKYDSIILSILKEDYQKYQQYINPIKKLINFHDLRLQKSLNKIKKKKS
ncbi:MAG: hypothetical protein ACTSRG_01100 [Candidatus Helarchaeota archaeon]